jgi:hypothetical protein
VNVWKGNIIFCGSLQASNRNVGSASFVQRAFSLSWLIRSDKKLCCVCVISPVLVVSGRKRVTWTQYYCCWVSILPTGPGGHPRFGGVTAVLVEIQVLWGVTLCRLTFRRSVVIPSSEWNSPVRTDFSEMSVTIRQSKRRPKCAVTAVFWVTRFLSFSIPFAVFVFPFSLCNWIRLSTYARPA